MSDIPDPKKHKAISFWKSGFRIIGCAAGLISSLLIFASLNSMLFPMIATGLMFVPAAFLLLPIAFLFLIIAEILGIYEEMV